MFIERPPLTTSPAERLAAEGYTKLLLKRLGPYRMISVGLNYVKTWQHGLKNTVSIKRITKVPRAIDNDNDDIVNEESRANKEH